MMRVVFDTNVIISGRLWSGAPRRALRAVEEGRVESFISEGMVDELKDVISRPKFSERLALIGKTAEQVVQDHLQITTVIEVEPISPTIEADPDDDMVLACALSSKADCVVSGDPHLLDLGVFEDIPILTVNVFLEQLEAS
jgi:putative PIN family toxin of toxin-antitoxin system